MKTREKTELLAPAGSYEAFRAALKAGADAVYLGGERFGARASAENFTRELLLQALDEAHTFGKKLYLTVNTLFKEQELEELYEFLLPYYRQGLDAVIVQDMGVLKRIRECFPDLALHASTQMTVTGYEGARFLEEYGVQRVVPARELSLPEIRRIREHTGLEIECFVHGALCYCYSGQCLMSSFIGGRSGNRGRCAQPCRLPWKVLEKGKPLSGEKNAYALNTKDICLVSHVPELIENGVTSFKIEGRMKRPEYTAGVVSVYRRYIDAYEEYGSRSAASPEDKKFLETLFNREGFSRSYFFQHNGKDMMALRNGKLSEHGRQNAEAAYKEVQERILSAEPKKEIRADFVITKELQAVLSLTDGTVRVQAVSGEAQPSLNRPLTEETVRKQLGKTGGTEFSLRELSVGLETDAFMTAKQLNELRREAFSLLREKMASSWHRPAPQLPGREKAETKNMPKTPGLWVSAQNRRQWERLRGILDIEGFYLPYRSLLEEFSEEERQALAGRVFVSLPYITRQTADEAYRQNLRQLGKEGFSFLVRSLEDIPLLLKEAGAQKLRLDYNLYTMNSEAQAFWKAWGITETTVPLELNKREILQRSNGESDLIIYGRIPLMISAQCLRKSYASCTHGFGGMVLKDRKGAEFPVSFQCDRCYNIIYNSVPLSLLSVSKDVLQTGAARLRVILGTESPAEAEKIVRTAAAACRGEGEFQEPFPFTRGHFNRGVQ